MSEADSLFDTISDLFQAKGAEPYSEAVSQTAHALQCAKLAEENGAAPALVIAALLHDVGHLLDKRGEHAAEDGIDARHEDIGAAWLRQHFGPKVTDPVHLHVAAKRYLCYSDPAYWAGLSPASKRSLELQGGPFDATEAKDFEQQSGWSDAVNLRKWDDLAKDPHATTPSFGHYREMFEACLRTVPG